jgi:cell division transport system permease protein
MASAAGDMLGLKRVFRGMLPVIVAAMTFLAALALGGAEGAAALGRHWRGGAAATLTVQVPRPAATLADASGRALSRRDRALAVLRATPGLAEIRPLGDPEVADLLRPWLGQGAEAMSMPLPAVVAVRLAPEGADLAKLRDALAAAAPGSVVEAHDAWVRRLALLARSLETCALIALVLVAGLAAAVVAVATRAGLAARRDAVEIVHGLGATDGMIGFRFARRAGWLGLFGGTLGLALALPVILGLAVLAAPFTPGAAASTLPVPAADPVTVRAWLAVLPMQLWLALAALPLATAMIGWMAARATVRAWLRLLP